MEINEGALDGITDFFKRRWQHFRSRKLGYMLWIVIIFFVTTCSVNIEPTVYYPHLYVDGTVVCMKLNNQRAQVIDHYDTKGRINHKCQLNNGKKNGYCLKFENEELVSAEKYQNGEKIKEWFSFVDFQRENKLSDLK